MKREFLQNLKIGDQAMTKEQIDSIMEENGKDIESAKKPFADYENLKIQLQTAKNGLKAFDGVDVNDLKGQITKLTGDLAAKDTEYQGKIADMEFSALLDGAITAAKGRDAKAVRAMLDVDALKSSKNQGEDVKTAIEALRAQSGYLFGGEENPPPPGAGGTSPDYSNMSDEQYYAAVLKK